MCVMCVFNLLDAKWCKKEFTLLGSLPFKLDFFMFLRKTSPLRVFFSCARNVNSKINTTTNNGVGMGHLHTDGGVFHFNETAAIRPSISDISTHAGTTGSYVGRSSGSVSIV